MGYLSKKKFDRNLEKQLLYFSNVDIKLGIAGFVSIHQVYNYRTFKKER